MAENLSRQTKESFELIELYDKVMVLATKHKLQDEVLNLLLGQLNAKRVDSSDNRDFHKKLEDIYTTIEELHEYGAQKNLDPDTIKSAKLQAERRDAIRKYEALKREIKHKSKQFSNRTSLPSCETPQERDKRWRHEVPRICKAQKCSISEAVSQVTKADHRLGRSVPRDPRRTYYRAKAAKESTF